MHQYDLDGTLGPVQPRAVYVFVDEAKPQSDVPWAFMGFLMIPADQIKRALRILQEVRDVHAYHKEIHFQELNNHSASPYGAKTAVARDWLESFIKDASKTWHFHLCGINTARLQRGAFGQDGTDDTIYNRFFRSGLLFGLKRCFDLPIHVKALYHDETHLQTHKYFQWHAIYKFGQIEPQITFAHTDIKFIPSDHNQADHTAPNAAHFIQMADVILGAFRQRIVASSNKTARRELGELVLPLVQRVTDERQARNFNSSFHHYRRVSVGFFPKRQLTEAELSDAQARALSGFYINEPLKFANRFQPVLWSNGETV